MAAIRILAAAALGYALAMNSAAAENARREAGAHVHGAGRLGIVIEGNTVSLELDTPAHDVLGFEHAPRTAQQKAALETAVAKLKDASKVFRLTPAADCRPTKAEAGLEQPEAAQSGKEGDKGGNGGHGDFSGTFVFECGAIGKLTAIELGYFAAFPDAAKLAITIVTAKGQASREATRAAPRIDLSGID